MVAEKSSVVVGGRRLAYAGMGQGSPAVVLESALGAPGEMWENILPEIARFTRVLCYDRAGLGESEPAGRRRTLDELAGDLQGLLDALQIPGPIVLAGCSFGGYIARYFAYLHPERTAGLVLIESNHPDGAAWMREVTPQPSPDDSEFLKGLRDWLLQEDAGDGEPEGVDAADDGGPEGIHFAACDRQVREASALGSLPLVVIAAANHAKDEGDPVNDPANIPTALAAAIEQAHLAAQEDLARLSTRGRFVAARESGHFVHRYEPELVVGVIRELVEEQRAGLGPEKR